MPMMNGKEKMSSRMSALTAPASKSGPSLPQMGQKDEEEMGEKYTATRSELQSLLDNGGEIELASGCKLALEEDGETEAPAEEEMAM